MDRHAALPIALTLAAWLAVASGLCGCGRDVQSPAVAVTTSYLECAVRDLAGDDVPAVRLTPPGSCPGHFDVSPGTAGRLASCRALFRFDFQSGMDRKFASFTRRGMAIVPVEAPEGLCVPASYLAVCRSLAPGLVRALPGRRARIEASLARIADEMSALGEECRRRIAAAGLSGAPVVASGHQAVFCRFLGLDVVATYSGADEQRIAALGGLIEAAEASGVRLVVANLQEGAAEAEALSERLGAPVVVLSNFPEMSEEQDSFVELVRFNLSRLEGAK